MASSGKADGTILSLENNSYKKYDIILYQNYPNPFNPKTRIPYSLSTSEFVELNVCDVNGRNVKKVLSERMYPGNHFVDFYASDLAGGVYFYTLKAGSFTESKKLLLLK